MKLRLSIIHAGIRQRSATLPSRGALIREIPEAAWQRVEAIVAPAARFLVI